MIGPKPHQPHARTQNRRPDVKGARSSWRVWLACGCLFLAVVRSVGSQAVQPDPLSGRASPPGVRETATPSEAPRLPRIAPDYLEVVREVQVRWPGGKTTSGQVPEGAKEIRVTADGNVEKLQ